MNTQKYVQAIVDATGISGETLGAVKLGMQLAVNDQVFAQGMLRKEVENYRDMVDQKQAIVDRLNGLEDQLLAWLDEHGKDLPITLAADYDQHLADVVVEVLNQQRVTIRTQHEALAAQKDAIGRMRQEPPPIMLYQNGSGQLMAATDSASVRNGHVVVLPDVAVADPTVPADWTHGEALYVELHRLAQNGIGPSKSRWNDERAAGMPLADEVIATTGLRWYHVLKAAGLMSPTKQPWRAQATEEEGTPANGDATFRA